MSSRPSSANDATGVLAATTAAGTAIGAVYAEPRSGCYRCGASLSSRPRTGPFAVCRRAECRKVADRDRAVAVALAQLARHVRWVSARQVGEAVGDLSGSQAFRALERLRCRRWVEVRTAPPRPARAGRSLREHRLSAAGRTTLGDAP